MDNKIFDEFPKVDCNECEHWWLNQCDGTEKDEHKVCHSFAATRHLVIPEQIKDLERKVNSLTRSLIIVILAVAIHLIFG